MYVRKRSVKLVYMTNVKYSSSPSENVTILSKVNDPVSASPKMSSVNTVGNVNYNITDDDVDNFPLLS